MPQSRRSISLAALIIPPILFAGSLAVLAVGIVLVVTENDALVAALNSTTATAADVYGGQARVAVASTILGAGILSLVVALATAAITGTIRAFAPRPVDTVSPGLEVHDDAVEPRDAGDLDDDEARDHGKATATAATTAEETAGERELSPRAS